MEQHYDLGFCGSENNGKKRVISHSPELQKRSLTTGRK